VSPVRRGARSSRDPAAA